MSPPSAVLDRAPPRPAAPAPPVAAAPHPADICADARSAAALIAVDPRGLGGVVLSAPAGPPRTAWLDLVQALRPEAPWRRVPPGIGTDRLLGGLDLAATLNSGRPVAERGVLAAADGGVVVLPMAERVTDTTLAPLLACLDIGLVTRGHDGAAVPARVALLALDERIADEAGVPPALAERLALHLDARALPAPSARQAGACTAAASDPDAPHFDATTCAAARRRLPDVTVPDTLIEALCGVAQSLGVDSLRAPLFALRAARAHAALCGRDQVSEEDAQLATRLVLAPRATQLPAGEPAPSEADDPAEPPDAVEPPEAAPEPPETAAPPPDASEMPPPPTPDPSAAPDAARPAHDAPPLDEVLLEAARAALPPGLLAQFQAGASRGLTRGAAGKSGAVRQGRQRGRPIGVRRGTPRSGERLNVIATLHAAAPWQKLRRAAEEVDAADETDGTRRVRVRADDFRLTRIKQRTLSTTIFLVDASGSAALHRLAEAKGAIELLLADCYVRRDAVALLALRGAKAELLLPPTRSLTAAKRRLAGLPGGGGTPMAAGLDAASELADSLRRRGQTPLVVLLSDGRANVARDGIAGRANAERDALAAATALRSGGTRSLFIDTAPRPHPFAARLAAALAAPYVALPFADATTVNRTVRACMADAHAQATNA